MANLRGDRGDTNLYDFHALRADGTDLNLTGATLWFTIKADANDPDPGLVQKTGNDIGVTDPTGGTFTVILNPDDTENITPGRYFWDCQVKESTGRVTTVGKGYYFLDPDYTRAIT